LKDGITNLWTNPGKMLKLYSFTTCTRATVQDVRVTDDKASFVVFDKRYLLKVEAEKSGSGTLHARLRHREPGEMEMQPRVRQSLTGKISIEFRGKNKNGEKLIYRGTGNHTGIEINGNIATISDE